MLRFSDLMIYSDIFIFINKKRLVLVILAEYFFVKLLTEYLF